MPGTSSRSVPSMPASACSSSGATPPAPTTVSSKRRRLVAAEIDAYIESGRQRLDDGDALARHDVWARHDPGSVECRPHPAVDHACTTCSSSRRPSPAGSACSIAPATVLWTEPPGQAWMGEDPGRASDHRQPSTSTSAASSRAGSRCDLLLDHPHADLTAPVLNPRGEDRRRTGRRHRSRAHRSSPNSCVRSRRRKGDSSRWSIRMSRVIAGSDPARFFQPARPAPPTGGEWMLATVPLTQAPWRVVAGQSRALALAEVWQFQRLLLTIGFGLVVARRCGRRAAGQPTSSARSATSPMRPKPSAAAICRARLSSAGRTTSSPPWREASSRCASSWDARASPWSGASKSARS